MIYWQHEQQMQNVTVYFLWQTSSGNSRLISINQVLFQVQDSSNEEHSTIKKNKQTKTYKIKHVSDQSSVNAVYLHNGYFTTYCSHNVCCNLILIAYLAKKLGVGCSCDTGPWLPLSVLFIWAMLPTMNWLIDNGTATWCSFFSASSAPLKRVFSCGAVIISRPHWAILSDDRYLHRDL